MVLSRDAFIDALTCLGELMPMGKTLSPQAVALAWGLFPVTAKGLLEPDHLLYAMQQLQLDPQPARNLSITVQLLRYLFPCTSPTYGQKGNCTSEGQPLLERGLRPDLPQRMGHPDVFHPLHQQAANKPAGEVLEQHRLLPPGLGEPGALALMDRLCVPLVKAIRGLVEPPELVASPRLKDPRQVELYAYLAAACAVGKLPLEALDRAPGWWRPEVWGEYRNGVREWIRTHPTAWALMQTLAEQQQADPCDGRDDGAAVLGLAGPFGSAVRSLRN